MMQQTRIKKLIKGKKYLEKNSELLPQRPKELCGPHVLDLAIEALKNDIDTYRSLEDWLSVPENRQYNPGNVITVLKKRHAAVKMGYAEFVFNVMRELESNALKDYLVHNKCYEEPSASTFNDVGLPELALMAENNPKQFAELRERGRRIVHDKNDLSEAIKHTVIQYEQEAVQASKAGAYLAAMAMLGSALEGILVLLCLKFIDSAKNIASQLHPKLKQPGQPTTWTFETLISVCTEAKFC